MMKRLLNKIKNLRISDRELLLAKIANLEEQIANLEQANVVILSKLLQIGNSAKPLNKRDEKSEVLISTQKGLNAGKTPTFH